MPTEEEWCAIIALANKAKNSYGEMYDTANQYKTVMKWAKKWLAQRNKVKENANKWNKEHRKRHNEINKLSYRRVKERKKNAKQEK